MDFRSLLRPLLVTAFAAGLGAAAVWILADAASARGFLFGAALIALATGVSGVFYLRAPARHAGLVLFRLVVSLALKWLLVLGGAWLALAKGEMPAGAFTAGVIAGLVASLVGFGSTSSTSASST